MQPLRTLRSFISGLWRFSRAAWVSVHEGLRPRSGASALVLFLFLISLIAGLVLVALGFDLADVEVWLDARGGFFNAAGDALFRLLCSAVLLICVTLLGSALYDLAKGKLRIGTMLVSLLMGYFAWIGVSSQL
jgi:hypothetical protein